MHGLFSAFIIVGGHLIDYENKIAGGQRQRNRHLNLEMIILLLKTSMISTHFGEITNNTLP
jgi:hypothetical protein